MTAIQQIFAALPATTTFVDGRSHRAPISFDMQAWATPVVPATQFLPEAPVMRWMAAHAQADVSERWRGAVRTARRAS